MLTRIRERMSGLSRKAWLAIGGGIFVLAAAIAAWVIFDPFGGPFERLDEKRPAYTHPDGLVLQLAPGIGEADVQVTTIPREEFLADQAGGVWGAAHAALSETVTPLSPIYTIKVRRGQVTADMAIPNDADPLALLDLVRWDAEAGEWKFVPSQQKLDQQTISFAPDGPTSHVMAVHVKPGTVAAGVIISQGGVDLGPKYGLALPEGISIDPQGQVTGTPASASASTIMPLVDHRDSSALNYADLAVQSSLVTQLEQIVLPYNGLVLDFEPGLGYADFVGVLARQIHAHGKHVDIVIRGASLDAYDVPALAKVADRVWFAPGDDPTLYLPHGGAEAGLAELIAMVDRQNVGLMVSGLAVDVSGEGAKALSLPEAVAPFGSVQPVTGYGDTLMPGDSLAVRLSGQVTSMGFDESLGMNFLTYTDAANQTHYIYLGSAQALERKLAWANTFALGAVAVDGLSQPGAPSYLADGLTAFLSQQQLGQPEASQLAWEVSGPDGSQVSQQSGDLSLLQYLWQAVTGPGQYVVKASLNNQSTPEPISTLVVNVAEFAASTPTLAATPTPTARSTAKATQPAATQATAPASQPTLAPVTGSIVGGSFELGGQVNGSIQRAEQMVHAGMTWVKFQHKWSAGESPPVTAGNINEAHAKGFKVLMSVPGPEGPSAIDFAGYASFVGGVAAQGADAIEVWNEMNLDREWPASDMSGTSYVTNMLAPAAAAIRAGNPNTMIISGAPSPSGAFGGCGQVQLPGGGTRAGCDDWFYIKQMADAGAANYSDCIGVHYNAGATSPSVAEGHPNDDGFHHYSWYYQPMVNLYHNAFGKPLCFTELGYASTEGVGGGSAAFPWADSISVAEQAQWLSEAAILASQSGKVRMIIIWNVDFSSGQAGDPQAAYAIVRPGGGCPACDALNNAH